MKLSGRGWDLSLSVSLRQSRKIRWKKVTYEERVLGRWWQQQHSFLISLNPSIKTDRIREQNQKFIIYIYKETKFIKGILRKLKLQACEEKPPTALRPAWYSICVGESRGRQWGAWEQENQTAHRYTLERFLWEQHLKSGSAFAQPNSRRWKRVHSSVLSD